LAEYRREASGTAVGVAKGVGVPNGSLSERQATSKKQLKMIRKSHWRIIDHNDNKIGGYAVIGRHAVKR
jgi:hypothetical protein